MSLFGPSSETVYLGIGSNLGDRAGNLLLAVRGIIDAGFEVKQLSAIYETEPVDMDDAPNFLNLVAKCVVQGVSPTQAMARLLRLEHMLGRTFKGEKKPRTVDIDILLFGDRIIETDLLTIPHPRMHQRRFVLEPLVELAPTLVHPVLEIEIADLLRDIRDRNKVERWDPSEQRGSGYAAIG
jgi:2-amino-4-hydroxy-6-hydroxymethyldihydropteridine diphosphokinase